jgi:dihydrofolate synthase/folylpolyglutamate synthase
LDHLAYLFRLEQFGIKFGLDSIETLLARLGHPERTFRSVHVAGTNGKGSVTAMVDTALGRAGYRSARYTSPHLIDLSERFVIDGRPVDAAAMRSAAGDVREAIEQLRAEGALQALPTFFEATTALAFELFRRAQVEIAAVEVGLGGRLDSTNVIRPVASAITSIDFDHQQYLGSTLREIAAEKAGIIKPGVPVVVGDVGQDAWDVIARVAGERGAELIRASDGVDAARLTPGAAGDNLFRLRTPARDYGTVRLSLRGAHQAANAIVAVRLLETLDARGVAVPPAAVAGGLEQVSWPGRLERRTLPGGRELLLDAAHNPAGAAALASYLTSVGGTPPVLVFAAMRDKDARGMLRVLLPAVGRVIVTRAANSRSADPDALAADVRAISPSVGVDVVPAPVEALGAAWRISPRVVVAGSIFLLGDIMKEIGA